MSTGRAVHFGSLLCDDPDLIFWCAPQTNLFFQIRKGLHVEHRTNYGDEELIEYHGLINAERLKERFVE